MYRSLHVLQLLFPQKIVDQPCEAIRMLDLSPVTALAKDMQLRPPN